MSGDEGERRYWIALSRPWRMVYLALRADFSLCAAAGNFFPEQNACWVALSRAGVSQVPSALGAAEAVGMNAGCWRHVAAVNWISGQAWWICASPLCGGAGQLSRGSIAESGNSYSRQHTLDSAGQEGRVAAGTDAVCISHVHIAIFVVLGAVGSARCISGASVCSIKAVPMVDRSSVCFAFVGSLTSRTRPLAARRSLRSRMSASC